MKFRRKLTIIEAGQFTGNDPHPPGVCLKPCLDGEWIKPHVHTAHRHTIILKQGEWVIPEPDGSGFYPCKDEIFRETYEPIE